MASLPFFAQKGCEDVKRYAKEAAVLAAQLFMFYIYPFFAGAAGPMGMVLIIIAATLVLSAVLGGISEQRIRFLYPAAAAVSFIPSVFIHYNESALVHALWYLVISTAGLTIGVVIRRIAHRK